ncbi:hypothetical protein GCM10007874_40470 [Labrys miyagiensis]|uniref:Uncharacterized protein n=1 Tax=Labrys miyagiensis TaxID=346912 RepID=A0ABQ6CMG2_9HYPH|nr:hypothetical protein GCM10007874_40470 [Labrys miyagiensis]
MALAEGWRHSRPNAQMPSICEFRSVRCLDGDVNGRHLAGVPTAENKITAPVPSLFRRGVGNGPPFLPSQSCGYAADHNTFNVERLKQLQAAALELWHCATAISA